MASKKSNRERIHLFFVRIIFSAFQHYKSILGNTIFLIITNTSINLVNDSDSELFGMKPNSIHLGILFDFDLAVIKINFRSKRRYLPIFRYVCFLINHSLHCFWLLLYNFACVSFPLVHLSIYNHSQQKRIYFQSGDYHK